MTVSVKGVTFSSVHHFHHFFISSVQDLTRSNKIIKLLIVEACNAIRYYAEHSPKIVSVVFNWPPTVLQLIR